MKFRIRFNDQKRWLTITGTTVSDYITSLGATSSSICPTGGWATINGETVSFQISI